MYGCVYVFVTYVHVRGMYTLAYIFDPVFV